MERLVWLLPLLLAATVAPQQTPRASSHPEDWELVWSDEFNGKDIDPTKWKYDTGGHGFGNNELQFYTDRVENAYLADGALLIHAQPEKFQNRNYTSAKQIGRASCRERVYVLV